MCCGGRREQKANACCAALVLAARQALLLGREKAGRATPVEAPCKGVCPSASCEAAGSALLKMGAPFPQQPAANLQTAWHVARARSVSARAEKYPLGTDPLRRTRL